MQQVLSAFGSVKNSDGSDHSVSTTASPFTLFMLMCMGRFVAMPSIDIEKRNWILSPYCPNLAVISDCCFASR
jgi:hypothetical protein